MQLELKMVHLQLSRRCNLNCHFCGQDHTVPDGELQKEDWFGLLTELKDYAPCATVVLWGGEPLLQDHFAEIAEFAYASGFKLELITNGTLIDRYKDILREKFERIYVSVDGTEEMHDLIRGKGIFACVRQNLEMLRNGRAEIVMMSVMAPENLHCFSEIPFGMAVDRVILHKMIYLTESEGRMVKNDAAEKWLNNQCADYEENLEAALEKLKKCEFPLPVEFQPHFQEGNCMEPYRHLHICADGETTFCTDFSDYSLGNIKHLTIKEVFEGEKAEKFRSAGHQPFCSHCSWKNTEESIVKIKMKPEIKKESLT